MPEAAPLSLGRALKQIRLAAGLSQRELAGKLDVDPTYISHLEKDRRDPSVKFLKRFAAANGVPTSSLLAVALWSELEGEERETFRPLLSSLVRLTGAVGHHAAE